MWAALNCFQANWAGVIVVVISVVRSLIVESLLYILFQILKTFQFFFIFTMKYVAVSISILINKNKLTNASVGQFYQTESLLNFTKTISEF